MMNKKQNKELSIEMETVKDCPIFYHNRFKSCQETSMCWGWEFNNGWDNAVRSMSLKLEALNNMFYPECRVRIQADQIKEKYGRITVYTSIVTDPSKFFTWLSGLCYKIYKKLNNVDCKCVTVQDVAPYDYDVDKEISKDEYERQISNGKCSNVDYKIVKNPDGTEKIIEIIHLHNYGKTSVRPTQHKIIYKIKKMFFRFYNRFSQNRCELTSKQKCAVEYLDTESKMIIAETERECAHICEKCGTYIGSSWSPACITTGWITYICDKCAEKSGSNYYKNGDLYCGDKLVKTKEELEKEKEEEEKPIE